MPTKFNAAPFLKELRAMLGPKRNSGRSVRPARKKTYKKRYRKRFARKSYKKTRSRRLSASKKRSKVSPRQKAINSAKAYVRNLKAPKTATAIYAKARALGAMRRDAGQEELQPAFADEQFTRVEDLALEEPIPNPMENSDFPDPYTMSPVEKLQTFARAFLNGQITMDQLTQFRSEIIAENPTDAELILYLAEVDADDL